MKKILIVFLISIFSFSVNAQKIENKNKSNLCKYDENKILKGSKFVCIKKVNKIVR